MSDMTSLQAISEGYHFLSHVLLDGFTPDSLRIVFPDLPVSDSDTEALEVAHYQVFGRNVYPYASVFLSEDGLKGGVEAEASEAFHQRVAWRALTSEPDHIAAQLGVLGWLAGAEADALADRLPAQAARVRALRRQYLDERILTWFPALSVAVTAQAVDIYTEAVRLALELTATDRSTLGEGLMAVERHIFALPSVPDVLADPKTSLRDIAHLVMTPALSGGFLSYDDLMRLARRHGLPMGFADRRTLLHNVFRVGVDYGIFPALIADLAAIVRGWVAQFNAMSATHPALSTGCAVWADRARMTIDLLHRVKSAHLDS